MYEKQRRGKEKEKGLVKLPHITTDEVMCFYHFASMRFLTTLGTCIKMQASVLTAGYIEGGEIMTIDQVYKTPMILL